MKKLGQLLGIAASIATIIGLIITISTLSARGNQAPGGSSANTPVVSSSTHTPSAGKTPTPKPTMAKVVSPNSTQSAPTPRPSPTSTAPNIAGTYTGLYNTDSTSTVSLKLQITQNGATITGYCTIGSPGSGPFTGTVASDGSITFKVTANDGSGFVTDFSGQFDSSAKGWQGSYTIRNNGQTQSWWVSP